MLQKSWHVGEDFAAAESASRKPTAIILEPSKDLAEQTHDFMVRFKQYLTQPQLRCELLIGGTNPKQASRALEEAVDIITGTPGAPHVTPLTSCRKLVLMTVTSLTCASRARCVQGRPSLARQAFSDSQY